MSRFIKLTKYIINCNDIHKITIDSNKYTMHMVSKKIDGFDWKVGGFGLGNISSQTYEIEITKNQNNIDYEIITEWINKI